MDKILDVMEYIKQNITDNQYKTIMDSLMAINKDPSIYKNHKSNKFICLFEWLDTKLEITDIYDDRIKRIDLFKFIIEKYYNNLYYENIDFVKHVLKYFLCMKQNIKTVTIILFMLNIEIKNIYRIYIYIYMNYLDLLPDDIIEVINKHLIELHRSRNK